MAKDLPPCKYYGRMRIEENSIHMIDAFDEYAPLFLIRNMFWHTNLLYRGDKCILVLPDMPGADRPNWIPVCYNPVERSMSFRTECYIRTWNVDTGGIIREGLLAGSKCFGAQRCTCAQSSSRNMINGVYLEQLGLENPGAVMWHAGVALPIAIPKIDHYCVRTLPNVAIQIAVSPNGCYIAIEHMRSITILTLQSLGSAQNK